MITQEANTSTPIANKRNYTDNNRNEYAQVLKDVIEELSENSDTQNHTTSSLHDSAAHRPSVNKIQTSFIDPPSRRGRFEVIQKWEGHVLEIDNEVFLARLIPISGQGGIQEAEMYLTEIAAEDKDLLEPGAVFYWSIGYYIRPSGNWQKASVIRFRRLPVWTEYQLQKAEREAHRWGDLFSAA